MTVGSPSVTLSTAAQAANFAVGDYVAVYQYTSGDVLPAQMSQVTGVNIAAGQLMLANSVIRPFATPSIAKVTRLAAHDIAINNVIVQGAIVRDGALGHLCRIEPDSGGYKIHDNTIRGFAGSVFQQSRRP